MIVVQLRRQIFRQTIPIEEARVTPLPTKFVKVDGIDASICAAKALAVNPTVLPKKSLAFGKRLNCRKARIFLTSENKSTFTLFDFLT